MSIFVYRKKPSTGAQYLSEALDAIRFKARTMTIEQKAKRGDVVVCWGETFPNPNPGVRVLNGAPLRNKLEDAEVLRQAGVSTIEVSRTRPAPQAPQPAPPDPALRLMDKVQDLAQDIGGINPQVVNLRSAVTRDALAQFSLTLEQLRAVLATPPPAAAPVVNVTWLPRDLHHVGGNDLLNPDAATVGYYVKKEEFVKEYRIHSFNGKSIRAGIKDLRDGFTFDGMQKASKWIRSWDGGWRIKYDGVSSRQKHRDLAHAAVKALGLTFGAVDIGERADGSLCVLEVNRAPGLEGGTIDKYAEAINEWINAPAA